MNAAAGAKWEQDTKDQKPNCHFWGIQSKNRVLRMIPAHSSNQGVGRPP